MSKLATINDIKYGADQHAVYLQIGDEIAYLKAEDVERVQLGLLQALEQMVHKAELENAIATED